MAATVRGLGAAALLIGILAASFWPNELSTDTPSSVTVFRFDAAACEELREERQTTTFIVPEEGAGGSGTTWGEVARRFNLELTLVCRANDLAADCGPQPLAAGEEVRLPLPRDARQLRTAPAAGPS